MPQINPDPQEAGYGYQRKNTVTAFVPAGQDIQPMLRALSDAGLANDAIDVFIGVQGAKKLDLAGEKQNAWVRFWRGLADETEVNQRAEKLLQSGGSLVAVFTDGDASQTDRTVEILKTHHGNEVTFWGSLTTERP